MIEKNSKQTIIIINIVIITILCYPPSVFIAWRNRNDYTFTFTFTSTLVSIVLVPAATRPVNNNVMLLTIA